MTTAALGHAVHTWTADPSTTIDDLIVQAFTELHNQLTSDALLEPGARSEE